MSKTYPELAPALQNMVSQNTIDAHTVISKQSEVDAPRNHSAKRRIDEIVNYPENPSFSRTNGHHFGISQSRFVFLWRKRGRKASMYVDLGLI